jgi:hypothetical protein
MIDVIIEVRGGVVQNVAVNHEGVRVAVADWDNLESQSQHATKLEWFSPSGVRNLAPETARLYGCLEDM